MEEVTLNNGVKMPLIGYGTYQTPARITEQCVISAIRAGYRSMIRHNATETSVKLALPAGNPVCRESSCF